MRELCAMLPHATPSGRPMNMCNIERQAIALVFEKPSGRIYGSANRAAIPAGRDREGAVKRDLLGFRVLSFSSHLLLVVCLFLLHAALPAAAQTTSNENKSKDEGKRDELTSSFTNSVEDLQSRLMLTAPKGRTALLDAIYLGLSQMRGAHNAKRALLILSDGGDNHSRYNESDIKRLVKEADTQLYAIGIFDPLGYRNRTPEELNGPSLLGETTEMTGGRVFAVENLNELPDIASKIGMELRNQYVLGYRPSNKAHDARWRKIKIKLRAPKGLPPLNVYSKTGYYAHSH